MRTMIIEKRKRLSNAIKNIWSTFILLLYATKGGTTTMNVRGHLIEIAVENWRTLRRAKTYSIKEPDTLDWIDRFEPDSCYFDIGANIGQYSLYPAKKYGDKIKIFAFEPQAINYHSLNRNSYMNLLESNIKSYCVAVSGESKISELYIPRFIPGGNRSQFGEEDIVTMKRPTTHIQGMVGITLDDLCLVWGLPIPNYIKIDVDGIEISIIKSGMKVLSNPTVKSVIVELGTREEQDEAVSLMKQAGFKVGLITKKNWGETCFIFGRDINLTP